MAKESIKFRAIKTVKKPITVVFRTNDGRVISFDATKTMKVKVPIVFERKKK